MLPKKIPALVNDQSCEMCDIALISFFQFFVFHNLYLLIT